MVTVPMSFTFLVSLLGNSGFFAVDMDITLESLLVLDRVLDLEQRLVELRLEVLLLVLNVDGCTRQGFKQVNVEPLNLGSERSL